METWLFLLSVLQQHQKAILLYVIDNKGSSPGRKGFKMVLAENGQFTGTIGGGIMEIKLLELAKSKMAKNDSTVLIKQQYHDKTHSANQSGLICSGEQQVAIIPLSSKDIDTISKIINTREKELQLGLNEDGMHLIDPLVEVASDFLTTIRLNLQKRIHVFGGGHVGHALTQVLSLLDYYILLYDDRPDLKTLKEHPFANEVRIVDYNKLDILDSFQPTDFVVIVTSSYRSDKAILKQLYRQSLSYIGMMGSDAKIEQLHRELDIEGITATDLSHVKTPIGIQILSKTAMEIAISIAGEIILENNRHLPTGRKIN